MPVIANVGTGVAVTLLAVCVGLASGLAVDVLVIANVGTGVVVTLLAVGD